MMTIRKGSEFYDESTARTITVIQRGAGDYTFWCKVTEDVYDPETDEPAGESVTEQLFTGRELASFAKASYLVWEEDDDDV